MGRGQAQVADHFSTVFGDRRGSKRLEFKDYVHTLSKVRLPDAYRGIWADGCTDDDVSRELPKLCEVLGLDLIYLWEEEVTGFYKGSSDLYVRDGDGCLHEPPEGLFPYLQGEEAEASIDLSTTSPDAVLQPHEYARGPVNGDHNYVLICNRSTLASFTPGSALGWRTSL